VGILSGNGRLHHGNSISPECYAQGIRTYPTRKPEIVSMKRYGQVVRLKPEKRDEYLRYHGAVWPGVLKTIAECNIRNYSIFEHGELLFAYFEYHGNDFTADMAKMAACSETKRWWALMFPMLEKLPPEIQGQRWTDLAEIFHFDGVP
jgi:L-rhamnose mutarotase